MIRVLAPVVLPVVVRAPPRGAGRPARSAVVSVLGVDVFSAPTVSAVTRAAACFLSVAHGGAASRRGPGRERGAGRASAGRAGGGIAGGPIARACGSFFLAAGRVGLTPPRPASLRLGLEAYAAGVFRAPSRGSPGTPVNPSSVAAVLTRLVVVPARPVDPLANVSPVVGPMAGRGAASVFL